MRPNHRQHDAENAAFGDVATHVLPARNIAPVTLEPCRTQMHPGVYKLALLCWVMLLAVFWATFAMSPNALFMVAIGTVYAIVFFGVPFVLSRIAGIRGTTSFSLSDFADGRFDTFYGPIRGLEALMQVILVPLSLTIGGVAIAYIIHAARTVH